MGRVTIMDVARAAGVSKGAASHALNDMPGVSAETRARVKAAAQELHWSPNSTARALSGAKAGAIGWAIVRTSKSPSIDPYFMELFAGIELELAGTDLALVVKLVADRAEEEALYRRWAAERRVDGVLTMDIDLDEQRFDLLSGLGLPFAAFRSYAGSRPPEDGFASVWSDESAPVAAVLDPAFARGHRRIAWVSGDARMLSIGLRTEAAESWARERGAAVETTFTDFSREAGSEAVRRILRSPEPPTCVVFDNDLMALAGLGAIRELGLEVPRDVSVLSWIDSALCEVSRPEIAALRHPTTEFGRLLTRRLLGVLESGERGDLILPPLQFVDRGSLGDVPQSLD
ncbi:LacI family DNA-binding transcriptional regulator [Frondihabitans australicus]|uniref:LacI family transcriptional regulator n=1 Tax=Frondihabitans australicus TaxID=386892 RepID=A0A495IJ45_9MICO|nr:LacI family DNA-binding transcriptional regulator [Frondihabitans australicus]RKR75155.1 LacI family transcriptional regulator [Frondihabitans australicus]